MPLRGVLFDMGGTLLHYTPPGETWEGMEKIGAGAMYDYLRARHDVLPPEEDALDTAWDYAQALWSNLDAHHVSDLKLPRVLAGLAARWGIDTVSPETAEALAQAYMAAVQDHVRPLDHARETLHALRDQGLRLGLISNTTWPGDAHRYDMDRYGLTPYFDHLLFSADHALWKPGKAVFQAGLDALSLAPDEAIYVGDSLYFDIWGAQQAGLRGVWIEQPHRWLPDGVEASPDATIQTLPQLLDVVNALK